MSDFDSYYNSLGTSQSDDSFDSYYKSIPTKVAAAQPVPKQTGAKAWSLGASLRNIDQNLGQILPPQMVKANQQQQELEQPPESPMSPDSQGQRNFARRLAAGASGVIGFGDTIANLPRYGINKVNEALNTGVQTPYTHYQDDFNALPGIKDLRQDAPEFFDTYADTAATVLPLPGRAGEALKDTAWINKTLGRRLLDAGATQGAIGGAQAINDRLQQGQDPSLWDVAGGVAGGAGLGVATHGLVEGAGRLYDRWKNGARVVPSNQEFNGPMRMPSEDIAKNLEGEDAQVFNQMRLGTPQQPLQGGLSYPDYIDFSQEPKPAPPQFTDVTRRKYPEYLDFSTTAPIAGRVSAPVVPPPVDTPPQGEFRKPLARSLYGHKEAFPGAGNTPLDAEDLVTMDELAKTKARLDQRAQQIDELSKAFFERKMERNLLSSLSISKGSTRIELNSKGQGLLDQFKADLQRADDKVNKSRESSMHLVASFKALAKDPADLSLLDDEPALLQFVLQQVEDEKKLKGLKQRMLDKYSQQYSDNPKYWPTFDHTITVNDQPYTVLLARHQEAKTIKFADERAEAVAEKIAELKKNPDLIKQKVEPGKIKIKKSVLEGLTRSSLALSGVTIMGSDQGAFAANQEKEKAVPGSATAIGALLLGAGFIKHPKAFSQLIKSTAGKVASRAAFIYGDMLDHARSLDGKLGVTPDESLENQIIKHQALVLQSQFGVHFASQEQKAALYQMLREKKVSPVDAIAGKGDFAALNQNQRQAVVAYYLYTKSMAKVVRDYRARLEGAVEQGLKVGDNEFASVVKLDEALTPRTTPVKDLSNLIALAHGNVMDGLFTLNPKHHLLNLTDSILAGGSRTGPINMFKAWRDLAANRELADTFKNSGLFGSFRAERDEVAKRQVSGTLHVPRKEFDFGSDKFNADRVFLAGLYQRYQEKAADMRKLGFANEQQYAKAILSGKASEEVSADAWAHAGETTMRTLGVDPLRVNKTSLQRSPVMKTVVSFVSQPIRMTRLIHEYIREGRTDRLAYLAGMTLLLGGQAVIPETLKLLGNNLAPDYEKALEKAANDLSLPGMIGNAIPEAKPFIPNVSEKLNYDVVNPYSFAGMNVPYDMFAKTVTGAAETKGALDEGNYGAASAKAWSTAKTASNLTGARVGPVPASQVIKATEALAQANSGQTPVSFYENNKKIAEGVSVDLDNYPAGRLAPITQLVTPGQSQLSAELKANRREAAMRKKAKDKDGVYNTDPLAGLKTPKTKDVNKKKEKELNEYIDKILATKD